MKIFKLIAICSALALCMWSCGGAKDVATEAALKEIASGNYVNEGKEYELSGYLSVPRNMFINKGHVTLSLHTIAGQSNDFQICKAQLGFGQQANSVYVPEKYSGSDMEIYDKDGSMHGYRTKVKLRGTVKYTDKDWEDGLYDELTEGENFNEKGIFLEKKREQQKKDQEAAEQRRKDQDGDANDYSFVLVVDEITVME